MPAVFSNVLNTFHAALAIGALLLLPGMAWAHSVAPTGRLGFLGASIAIGLPLCVLPAIFLAEVGIFSKNTVFLTAVLATILGARHGRGTLLRNSAPIFFLFVAILFVLLLTPSPGEWILGGWDPGVNANQGLLLARTGRVGQAPNPLLADTIRAAPNSFTREHFGFTELFPGVPIDPQSGAIRPYFYRVTPAWIAVLDTLAGREIALRGNQVLALLACALLAACLGSQPTILKGIALAIAALLFAHPIVVAHHGDPASEMLELVIVVASGFLLAQPKQPANAAILFLLLLVGALNRPSFLFHLALLLSIVALWDFSESDRRLAVTFHLAIAGAMLAGFSWYLWCTPESLVKIQHWMPLIFTAGAVSVVLTLAANGTAHLLRSYPGWFAPSRKHLRLALFAIPLFFAMWESMRSDAWSEFLRNAPAWLHYAHPLLAGAALLGLLWRGWRGPFTPWIAWLSISLFAALIHRYAAELYPWATKRWLAWSPPLIAAGIAFLANGLSEKWPRAGKAVALAILVIAMAAALPRAYQAWKAREHLGSLAALDHLAGFLRPTDLVVSDHFRFGTPLSLAYGFDVLNAEPLLAGAGRPEDAAAALSGVPRRIVLLTSTRAGLAAWPESFRSTIPLCEPMRVETQERIQHRRNRGFATRERAYTLQLHEWKPAK